MIRTVATLLVIASLAVIPDASAQQCIGAPPWTGDVFRLGARVIHSSTGSGFGGHLGSGVPLADGRSVFAEISATRVTPADEPELTAMGGRTNPAYAVEGDLGVELPVAHGGALSLCPSVGLGYTSGPETLIPEVSGLPGELEVEQVSLAWRAGAWLGGTMGRGTWRLLPAVGMQVMHDRTTTTLEGQRDGDSIEESETRDATWMRLSLATGIDVGEALSVLPRVSLPATSSGPRATVFTLAVSLSVAW